MLGDEVGDLVGLEVAPHVFGGVEFRGVSRQAFDLEAPRGAGYIVPHQRATVDAGAVPEDQQLAGKVTLEVAEELHDLGSLDASGVDLEVEAQEGQSANDREALPVEGLLEHGRLAPRGPGARPGGPRAQAALVDEDDQPALAAGFFFSAGQRTCFQWPMAGSSRSTARRSGR